MSIEQATVTPVAIGSARGGPGLRTLRRDRWWVQPTITVTILTAFVVYSLYAVFVNSDYYVGAQAHRDLISPFYSPCITGSCVAGAHGTFLVIHWWMVTPALLVMGGPLAFRLTCYYYRRAYYRGFWQSPPACAVADSHNRYSGETRLPLVLQNAHRYFLGIGIIFNVILTIDAIMAFRMPGQGGIGVSVGTIVLVVNALLLWAYTGGCHAARHLCGGGVASFSKHPVRYRLWKILTPLNVRHMQFAWASLIFVALCDLYVRLVAAGVFNDPKLF
ncbi:MAG: hypothetical protein ACRDVP_00010 [Acidimicrobiales bacterium]